MTPGVVGTVLVVLAAVGFGTLGPVSRRAEELGMTTLAFVAWRAGLAAVVLLPVVLVWSRLGGPRLGRSSVPRRQTVALLVATGCAALLNLAIFAAFGLTTVAVALIVFYAYPALVTIGAVRFHGERLDRPRAVALAVASAGLVLVLLAPALEVGGLRLDAAGVALAFLAALAQAVYVLVSARGYPSVPSAHASTVVLGGAAVIYLVLLGAAGAIGETALPTRVPELWPWVVAAGVTGAALPTTFLLIGIRSIGPSGAAILMTLEPVVGVALAAAFLGERPLPLQVVGGAAVLLAAAILRRDTT